MLRRRPTTCLIQSVRCQNLYQPGDGLRPASKVLNPDPEPPITWKTHTIFGNKREELFHYTDRKAGYGYTNFRAMPYKHRPFIFPVAKKPYKIGFYVFVFSICIALLDHDAIDNQCDIFMHKHFGTALGKFRPPEYVILGGEKEQIK